MSIKHSLLKLCTALFLSGLLFTGTAVAQAPELHATSQQDEPAAGHASLNWAGYAVGGSGYTAITGSWVVPAVSVVGGAVGSRADATWVGIGGMNSNDLLQAGTQTVVGHGGEVTYQAWYEMLPDFSIPVELAVKAGDSVTATLTETSDNEWQITIQNNTTGQQYQKDVQYNSSLSSAEWVEERVSDADGSFWPLDNFGSVQFFNAFATQNGQQKTPSELGAQPLTMVTSSGQILATTSDINNTGTFTIARSDASTSAVPTYAVGMPSAPQTAVVPKGFIIITIGPGGITVNRNNANEVGIRNRRHWY